MPPIITVDNVVTSNIEEAALDELNLNEILNALDSYTGPLCCFQSYGLRYLLCEALDYGVELLREWGGLADALSGPKR